MAKQGPSRAGAVSCTHPTSSALQGGGFVVQKMWGSSEAKTGSRHAAKGLQEVSP